jgi:hypothetical protein
MPNFKKRLRTEFGNAEFTFTSILGPQGVRYHVLVLDANHKTCVFTMVLRRSQWQIIHAPLPPQWILELESELAKAIVKHNSTE